MARRSLHLLFVVILIFIVVIQTQNNASRYTQIQEVVDYVDSAKQSKEYNNNNNSSMTTSASYTRWVERENKRRETELDKSKDIFLPTWMLDYIVWHKQQRAKVDITNNTSTTIEEAEDEHDVKYLVVRCLEGEVCGGFSDRMKGMPFYVMLANLTQRVLLIHWRKPCELEEFLVPPQNGLDWRVEGTPVTIQDIRNDSNFYDGHGNGMSKGVRELMGAIPGSEQLVEARVLNILLDGGQRIHNAIELFNMWRKEPGQVHQFNHDGYLGWNTNSNITQHDLFEDVFRILFEPSPNLQRAIYDKLLQLDIIDREYSVAQVRSKQPNYIPNDVAEEWGKVYAPGMNAYDIKRKMDMMETFELTDGLKKLYIKMYANAIECANQLSPGLPIFLASDSDFGIQMKNLTRYPIRVAASENDTAPPLHIDNNDNQGRNASDFYLVFIDIFIMASGKCLAHSSGFGSFPLRMNGITCELDHTKTECSASSNRTADAE